MIPSPNTAIRVSAPPENRSMKLRNPCWPCASSASCRIPMSTTGTGPCENDERDLELAAAEDLHGPPLADQAVGEQRGGVDLAAREHLAERLDVDDRVLDAGRGRGALPLRHPSGVRHLA